MYGRLSLAGQFLLANFGHRADTRKEGSSYGRLTLARQFLLASLAILLLGMLAVGAWVGEQIENGVVNRTAAVTALYVESVLEPYIKPLARQGHLNEAQVNGLGGLLKDNSLSERVVAFKVWSPDGEVLYSEDRRLIGQRYPIVGGLANAVKGEVVGELSDLSASENEFERQHYSRLLEVYVPVREGGASRIIAVVEFYQVPTELENEVAAARLRSWLAVAGATLASYLLLAGIVKRGSDTILRQETALRRQVTELSQLLEQNARLHERVRLAARRTTEINEQALRRISADLHDGPGQALALALLRLDALESRCGVCDPAVEDVAVARLALRDALKEIRALMAGLRLPELAPLSVAEVAQRAIQDHEWRSGTHVELEAEDLPAQAPMPIKIALFRALQESLSNSYRHGGGVGVSARMWTDADRLFLNVSDRGPGFVPDRVEPTGHLGLAGMREQTELLGGHFKINSAPGQGTTVRIEWPMSKTEESLD